jgi:hypothetical protein
MRQPGLFLGTIVASALVLGVADCFSVSQADVFVLHNGGRIRGRLINRDDRPLKNYVIETEHGGRVLLDVGQIQQTIRQDPKVDEYERIASKAADTADGQWKVAEWCRENGLKGRRRAHLRRIIHLDPDHAGARYGLGYSQVKGQWVTPEEIQKRRGYEMHDGRWRLRQEIALLEAEKKLEQAEKDWLTRLMRWREMLGTEKTQEGVQRISSVRDPHAVRPLAQMLSLEPLRQVKMLYIRALAEIRNRPAVQALYTATLQDPDEEIFHACLDALVRINPPHMSKQYVDVLKDKNNVRLNRAAHALGRLEDKSVISPLIDALVTTHHIVIPKQSDAYTSTFMKPAASASSPFGPTSFSAGGETKVIPVTVTNQDVLQALINLSGGANFGFDERAWQYWLANENTRTAPQIDSRRDAD